MHSHELETELGEAIYPTSHGMRSHYGVNLYLELVPSVGPGPTSTARRSHGTHAQPCLPRQAGLGMRAMASPWATRAVAGPKDQDQVKR